MKTLYRFLILFSVATFSLLAGSPHAFGQTADFTGNPTVTCIGGQVVFTDASTGTTMTTTWEWDFGSGANPATANGKGPHTVVYNTIGSKNVKLTLRDGLIENTKTRNSYITVNQTSTITLTSGLGSNIQTICLNSPLAPTITYATTNASGASFSGLPPGVTGFYNNNLVTISGTPTSAGNFNYTVTLTGSCGASSANGSITVNPLPTPTLVSSMGANPYCAGTNVTFSAGGGTDYTFLVNDVPKQTGEGPIYVTNNLINGDVVKVIVTSASGCSATSAGITNTVYPLPTPNIIGPLGICGLPTTAVYNVNPEPNHSYNWTVNGGTIVNGQGTHELEINWATVGNGTVSVVETVDATGCSKQNSISVIKAPASVGGTLSGSKIICEGSTSGTLTLNGYVGNILKWQYSTDLNNWVDTLYHATSFVSKPLNTTTYFRAIVQSGGCAVVSSTTATITVNPTPTVVIHEPSRVCEPATVNLTLPAITAGSSPGLTFSYWTDAQATQAYATPQAATNGIYYIKGESVNGCYATKPVNVNVSAKPHLVITPNYNPICVEEPLRLKLTGQEGSVWKWINPDTTNVNPVFLFPSVGSHTYKATATNLAGCVDTVQATINVLSKPVVQLSLSGGNNVCAGSLKTFKATKNINFTYEWFVNGTKVQGATADSLRYTISGTQPIKVKVRATNTPTGCYQSDSLIVNPIQPPVLVMHATKSELCKGSQTYITLSSPSTPPVYFAWGDGLQGNVLTRGFIPTQDTLVWAEAINSTGCIMRDTVHILVRDTLAFTINASNNGNPVCTGNEVTFTGPAAASYKYQWYVNGTAVAGAKQRTFVRSFTQNATVRLIVNDTIVGCSGSHFVAITTKPAPIVNLGPDQQVCQGYSVDLTGPAGTGYTYAWYRNNEATPLTTNRELHYIVPAGTSLLRLEVSSPEGCTTTDEMSISSKAVPGISITANAAEVCEGTDITLTLTTTNATGHNWWDNFTGSLTRVYTGATGDSTYVFWAEAVNSLSCSARDTVEVFVRGLPTVTIQTAGGNANICKNEQVTVTGPNQPGYQYQWYLNGNPAGSNSHQFSFTMRANAQVKLKVTDSHGCSNTSSTLQLQVIDLPGIILTPDSVSVCLGNNFTLKINNQNVVSYSWFDGLAGHLKQRTFATDSLGVGNFIYWAEGKNAAGCVSRDTTIVKVLALPIAHINPPPLTTICQGQTVTLNTTMVPGHQYKWLIGNDSVGNGSTYVFNKLQTKTIKLRVTNANGCVSTDEITINVEEAPVVDLGGNRTVCQNYTLDLSGPINENYTYKWFVNGVQINDFDHNYRFIVTQPVLVKLEVKVGNCTTSDQITVTPIESPLITVSSNSNQICFGDTIFLSVATQNANSHIWWDGFTGHTNRAYVPFVSDTTLVLWAQAVNGMGCTARDSVSVRINPVPEVPLSVSGGSNLVCFNSTATISGPQVAGHHYQWYVDNVPVGTNSYQYSFTVTKDVTVRLVIEDINGCTNENQIAILARIMPGIILTPDSLDVCLGESYTLKINTVNVNSFAWFDGLMGHLNQRSFSPTTAGTYVYWAEGVNNYGCVSRDTTIVRVHALPQALIFSDGPTTVCEGTTITLTGNGGNEETHEWFVGGELVSITPTYSFEIQETTPVTLRLTNEYGCQDTAMIIIHALDKPLIELGPDMQSCDGYQLHFDAPVYTGYSYLWYKNNEFVSSDTTYSFVLTGHTQIKLLVVSAEGCLASDSVFITRLPSPFISLFPPSSEICLGENATLTLTTNGNSFIWWDGLGTNVNTRSFAPSIGDSTYAFWAEAINAQGCKSRDTAYVTVNNPPEVHIAIQGVANTFCKYSQAIVQGPVVEGYQYQWYINGVASGDNSNRLQFPVLQQSLVKLKVTDANGCLGSDSLTVYMHNAPGIILTPDSLDVCFGDSFTLHINPQNVVSFAWWDGLAGNLLNRTIYPSSSDSTYVYWAQGINSIGCISYDTAYISVHSEPQTILLSPIGTSICRGDTMFLETPQIPGYTYEWTINGMVVSTQTILEFEAETTVMVTLTTTNEYGCSSSESVEIEVFDTPQIELGETIHACEGSSILLQGPLGAGYTYEWFVNGESFGVYTPDFEYTVTVQAVIRLDMNTNNGCTASDSILVIPLVAPKVEVTASASNVCIGSPVTLIAEITDAAAFEWWDGYVNPVRTVLPSTPGEKKYWAKVTSAANCISTDTIAVTVHPKPEIFLNIAEGASSVCEGSSITFAVSENSGIDIDYVIWDHSVTVPFGNEPVLYFEKIFTQSAWFSAEMMSSAGCHVSDSIFINVEALPVMTISNDTTVCQGSTLSLQATGGAYCIWSDDNGPLAQGYTFTIEALETKTYSATVYSSGNLGCSTTEQVTVFVELLPVLTVQASQQNECGGTPVVLSASGANTYVWSTGQTGASIVVAPYQTTVYTVTGFTDFGCMQTASLTLNVIPAPEVNLSGLAPSYCSNQTPVTLVGLPAGGIYSGTGVLNGKFYPSIAGPGTHLVVYTFVNSYGCTGSDTLQTTVIVVPESINLGEDIAICPHEQVVLDAGPGFDSYYWSTGQTTQKITIKGNAYFAGTTRTITVIAMTQECAVSGSLNLTIRNDCYIGLDERELGESITLAPNPTTGQFSILNAGNDGRLEVSIFDGRSANVFKTMFEDCTGDGHQCDINLSHLPKGVYIVSIVKNNRSYMRKLVIM